ncbi:hypothetical protein G6F57_002826 [Rhizopus arrhizus]|uniref:Sulfhydryl oxidase n=1 Tax=Rhizopus oryzae TaxID=64495 RepID=A0A9P7BSD2_RHIOR|nr:hypothetical protein G6F23_007017 [Rhizopus arrhizus]KAG1418567.1 hypothetical protein G6F58_005019 [Rhizopus delemar]KAG0767766.1 hypothetical protein G6F24_002512 [Rhizopus arrhizus]KAG0793946.1 hypothetical protein G6F21_003230 [Rhizopus arrhizus]KAG0806733.1 hypothetical protein G6F20_010898 [Rhizopus arrhizus]
MKSSEFAPEEDTQVIMAHMTNQTERAELGRATWKFLHTMMARYPEIPTKRERESLNDFMFLFSKLYPCGECAHHFNQLITKYPPQTSSRSAASQWLCAMHNRKKMQDTPHKRLYDNESIAYDFPRKRFISEENFAKDMAAMSLNHSSNCNPKKHDGRRTIYNISNFMQTDKGNNVIRIDDINKFLAENKDDDSSFMSLAVDHKTFIDDVDSGLLLEIDPGDSKPRVPDFILSDTVPIDPRDKIALEDIMKHQQNDHNARIEVLNEPSVYSVPIDMELD